MNNDEILKVHNKFIKSTKKFNDFVLEKDEKSFIENIEESKKFFAEEAEK
jgi:prephenate dehydrogenase